MDERDDGGSAFPGITAAPAGGVSGMSLRDYFAAAALETALRSYEDTINQDVAERIARKSYILADAMLKERAK